MRVTTGGAAAERLVHRTGHPSFTEALARTLVADLTVTGLRETWALSGAEPAHPASSRARDNLVVLRGVLLDVLAETDPDFTSWLRAQGA